MHGLLVHPPKLWFSNEHKMAAGVTYEVAVLGAGVEGSSTAYYLTQKAGVKNVLLLEQVMDANWDWELLTLVIGSRLNLILYQIG